MPIVTRNNGDIMQLVNHLGHYKDYLYIGYFTIDSYNKLKYKTKLLVKDKKDKLYNSGWFPTFVKLDEWYKPAIYTKPKRFKLQRKSNGKKNTVEQKMETSRSRKR